MLRQKYASSKFNGHTEKKNWHEKWGGLAAPLPTALVWDLDHQRVSACTQPFLDRHPYMVLRSLVVLLCVLYVHYTIYVVVQSRQWKKYSKKALAVLSIYTASISGNELLT